jgi:hypothetical protein
MHDRMRGREKLARGNGRVVCLVESSVERPRKPDQVQSLGGPASKPSHLEFCMLYM